MSVEGFDPQFMHNALSDYWLEYEEKGWLNKFWESICQVMDEEYLELYHANFSKSVLYTPVYIRRLWLNYTFLESDWIPNEQPHWHKSYSWTAIGGETEIDLPFDIEDTASLVFKNGLLMQYSREYLLLAFNKIGLKNPASPGDKFIINFSDFEGTAETHSHKIWQEYLLFDKQDWTDDPGDVFAVHGEYEVGAANPIQIYVDGVLLDQSLYTETSSTLLQTTSIIPAGSQVIIRWINTAEDVKHTHLKAITWYPSGSESMEVEPVNLFDGEILTDRFKFNQSDDYVDDTKRDLVWIGGKLKTKDENDPIVNADYRTENDRIYTAVPLTQEECIVTEVIDPGFSYYVALDPQIVRVPKLQSRVESDTPDIQYWNEYEDYEIKNDRLYSSTKFEDVWAFESYVNEETPYYNFGEPIDFYRPNDAVYLGMVQALWRAYWSGPRVYITEEACKMLLDVPFVSETSKIISITDSGEVNKRYYIDFENGTTFELRYPLVPRFSEGDEVQVFDTLSNGVAIYDAVNNPNWYKRYTAWLEFFEEFYYTSTGNPFPSVFDDGWIFDDGGRFDHLDYRFLPESIQDLYKERLFQALKHFVFAVEVDIDLIPETQNLDDVKVFLDRLKPAYTTYIVIATKNIKDELQKFQELFEADFDFTIKDYFPAPEKSYNVGTLEYTVISYGLLTPPGSPNFGDYYVIGIGAIGDWLGHDNEIAMWNLSGWYFISPSEGTTVYSQTDVRKYTFWNGSWLQSTGDPIANPYFDDGGRFDIEFSPYVAVATPGQTMFQIAVEAMSDGDWIAEVNDVAKSRPADWDFADAERMYVEFTVPMSGGEIIKIYKEDFADKPFDWKVMQDVVTFELTP